MHHFCWSLAGLCIAALQHASSALASAPSSSPAATPLAVRRSARFPSPAPPLPRFPASLEVDSEQGEDPHEALLGFYERTQPLIYFLHIPKAAGQSFQTVIQDILEWPTKRFVESLDPDAVQRDLHEKAPNWVGEMMLFNETRQSFGKLDPEGKPIREPALRFDMSFASYDTINALMARPEHLAQQEYQAVTARRLVVVSHADVRLKDASHPSRPTEIITMLRDPMERQISWYCFLRSLITVWERPHQGRGKNPDWQGHKHWCKRIAYSHPHFLQNEPTACFDIAADGNSSEPLDAAGVDANSGAISNAPSDRNVGIEHSFEPSPESFRRYILANRDDALDNYMTRAYAGCLSTTLVHDTPAECSEPSLMLALAKRNLESFLFVGITERYEDSVRLLEHALRFDGVCFPWERPKHLPKSMPKDPKKRIQADRPQPGMRSARGRRMVRNTTNRKDDCVEALLVPEEGTVDEDGSEPEDEASLSMEPEYHEIVTQVLREVDHLDFELYDFAKELFDGRLVQLKEELDGGAV